MRLEPSMSHVVQEATEDCVTLQVVRVAIHVTAFKGLVSKHYHIYCDHDLKLMGIFNKRKWV